MTWLRICRRSARVSASRLRVASIRLSSHERSSTSCRWASSTPMVRLYVSRSRSTRSRSVVRSGPATFSLLNTRSRSSSASPKSSSAIGGSLRRTRPERIQVGGQVPELAVGLDQALHAFGQQPDRDAAAGDPGARRRRPRRRPRRCCAGTPPAAPAPPRPRRCRRRCRSSSGSSGASSDRRWPDRSGTGSTAPPRTGGSRARGPTGPRRARPRHVRPRRAVTIRRPSRRRFAGLAGRP